MSCKNKFISCHLVSELYIFLDFGREKEMITEGRKEGDGEFALLSLYQRRFIGLMSHKHNFFYFYRLNDLFFISSNL